MGNSEPDKRGPVRPDCDGKRLSDFVFSMFQRRASRRHSVVSVGSVAHDEEFGPTVQLLLCRATFPAVTFRLLSIIHAFLGSTPLHMSMALGLGVQAGCQ